MKKGYEGLTPDGAAARFAAQAGMGKTACTRLPKAGEEEPDRSFGARVVAAGANPLCAVICLLRGFALAGEDLMNPWESFKSEYKASSDAWGILRDDSFMGVLSSVRFDREQNQAQRLSELWQGERSLTPEQLLLALAEKEPLFARWRANQAPGETSAFLLGMTSDVTGPGTMFVWRELPLAKALVECERYLHDFEGYVPRGEGKSSLMYIDDTARTIEDACVRMFDGFDDVPNPLFVLRREDALPQAPACTQSRATALEELEGLSRRVWNLRTSITVTMLMGRLALQADGGLADLALIDSYGSLIDAHPRPSVPEAQRERDSNLDEVFIEEDLI